MDSLLQDEFEFYIANQERLVEKYRGKFVVIKDGEILGAYDSDLAAIRVTQKEHELGTFLIQKCEPGKDNYTHTFHTRVVPG